MNMDLNKIEKCKDAELLAVLRRLKEYEAYCKLLDGDLTTYVKTFEDIGRMPSQLKEFLKLFDGGILITTDMFSTRSKAEGEFSRILTFEEVNSETFKEENGIHPDAMCFAMTNYGNYYCYVRDEDTGWVYEWDVNEQALTVQWPSFANWLDEQLDFAESLLRDGILEPLEG